MVIVTGGALGAESFFRADLPSADACLEATLAHLESRGGVLAVRLRPDRGNHRHPSLDRALELRKGTLGRSKAVSWSDRD